MSRMMMPAPVLGNAATHRRVVLLGAAIVTGACLALLLMPAIFVRIETDLSRSQSLLAAMRRNTPTMGSVVLGSSVVMAGIDARLIRPSHHSGDMWTANLGSTGQTLPESLLLYQELPASVRLVIQVVGPYELLARPRIPGQKYNALYMYGYRPTARTAALVHEVLRDQAEIAIDRSDLAQRFQARWAIRTLADRGARRILRGDLQFASSESLVFPNIYTERFAPGKFKKAVAKQARVLRSRPQHADPAAERALQGILEVCHHTGRRLVLLIPPGNPRVAAIVGDGPRGIARKTLQRLAADPAVTVVDASDVLTEAQFVDGLHPTREGARVLSTFVNQRIAHLR